MLPFCRVETLALNQLVLGPGPWAYPGDLLYDQGWLRFFRALHFGAPQGARLLCSRAHDARQGLEGNISRLGRHYATHQGVFAIRSMEYLVWQFFLYASEGMPRGSQGYWY